MPNTAPQVSEYARLVVALVVLLFVIRVAGALRMEGTSRPMVTGVVVAVYASYLFTIVEAYVAGPFFNALQHLSYGVAGVFAVLTVLDMRRQVIEERRTCCTR